MKNQTVIYYASGENQGTYDPLCFKENFTGNLTEKVTRFRSYDDDHNMVEVNKYQERNIQMPLWMGEGDYLLLHVKYKFAVALAGKVVLKFNRDQFFRFVSLNESQMFWYGWAIKSKSLFLKSMVFQFEQWLNEKTKFETPLSPKQWEAAYKYCPVYKARQISDKLYYSQSV